MLVRDLLVPQNNTLSSAKIDDNIASIHTMDSTRNYFTDLVPVVGVNYFAFCFGYRLDKFLFCSKDRFSPEFGRVKLYLDYIANPCVWLYLFCLFLCYLKRRIVHLEHYFPFSYYLYGSQLRVYNDIDIFGSAIFFLNGSFERLFENLYYHLFVEVSLLNEVF